MFPNIEDLRSERKAINRFSAPPPPPPHETQESVSVCDGHRERQMLLTIPYAEDSARTSSHIEMGKKKKKLSI